MLSNLNQSEANYNLRMVFLEHHRAIVPTVKDIKNCCYQLRKQMAAARQV